MSVLSAITIAYAFSLGISNNSVALWQSEYYSTAIVSQNLITSQFDVSIGLKGFYLGGSSEAPAKISNATSFIPLKNTYSVNAGYKYKCFEIGYVHHCSHPHVQATHMQRLDYVADGVSDKFFVKFQHQFNPFGER